MGVPPLPECALAFDGGFKFTPSGSALMEPGVPRPPPPAEPTLFGGVATAPAGGVAALAAVCPGVGVVQPLPPPPWAVVPPPPDPAGGLVALGFSFFMPMLRRPRGGVCKCR